MSSMVGLWLDSICPSNFKHSGIFEKNSALLTVSSLRLLTPSSPLHYGHLCCLKFITCIVVCNIAFAFCKRRFLLAQHVQGHWRILPHLPYMCSTQKTRKTSCTLLQPYHGNLFCKTFEYQHKHYLVTVDHCSDFYELDQLDNTLSTTIVNLSKAHFTRHGTSLHCLTDKGAPVCISWVLAVCPQFRFWACNILTLLVWQQWQSWSSRQWCQNSPKGVTRHLPGTP